MSPPGGGPSSQRLDAETPALDLHLGFAATQFADSRVANWHWPGHLGGTRTRDQVRELIEAQRRQHERDGLCLWWWRERETDELVGMAGLNRTEIDGKPMVELGWSIAPAFQRRGYATEAAAASARWGFDRCELAEIVAFTMPTNAASLGVIRRLNMRFVREFDRKGFPHLLYRLTTSRS